MSTKKLKAYQKDTILLVFLAFAVLLHFWNFLIPKDRQFLSGDFLELAGMRELFYQYFQKGALLLWDPLIATGMPYQMADPGLFYPIDLVISLFVNDYLNLYRLALQHALHFWLAGVFAYIYTRQLGFLRTAALVSSITFMLGGFLIGHVGHRNMVQTIIWLPLVLYFLDKALLHRRVVWAALSGLVLAFSFLAGHAQIFYYMLLFLGLYYCFRVYEGIKARSRRQIAQDSLYFLVAGVFLLGISAVQLFPTIQGDIGSHQAELPFDWKTQFSLPLTHLIHLWISGYWEWTTSSLDEHYIYSGLVPLLFSLWSLIGLKNSHARFIGVVLLFSLLMALGNLTPVYSIFYHILPGLSLFRIPARINALLVFSLAILAGYGCQMFLSEKNSGALNKGWKSLKMLHVLFLSAGVAVFILLSGRFPQAAPGQPPLTLGAVFIKNFLPFFIFLFISYLILLAREKYGAGNYIAPALVLLISCDLLYSSQINPNVLRKNPTRVSSEVQSTLKEIKKDNALFRIYNEEEILPSFLRYRHKIHTADIESAPGFARRLIPKEYLTLFFLFPDNPFLSDLANTKYLLWKNSKPNFRKGLKYWKLGGGFDDHELELERPVTITKLSVYSFLSHSAPIPQGQKLAQIILQTENGDSIHLPIRAGLETAEWAIDRPGLKGLHQKARVSESWEMTQEGYQAHAYVFEKSFPGEVRVSRFKLEYLSGQGDLLIKKILLNGEELAGFLKDRFHLVAPNLYENPHSLPRAFMIARARAFTEEKDLLEHLEQLNPRKTLLLSHLPPGYREPADSGYSENEAEILQYTPMKISIRTKAQRDKFLVLSDTYSPYWKASMDQKTSPLLKADYGLRGLFVPKGDHHIVFSFHFTPFYYGLAVTLFTLVAVILFSFWGIWSSFIKRGG